MSKTIHQLEFKNKNNYINFYPIKQRNNMQDDSLQIFILDHIT